MNKPKLTILVLVLIIIAAAIIFWQHNYLVSNSDATASNSAIIDTSANEYKYQGDFVQPNFAISYPQDFTTSTSDASASWDLTLQKENHLIQVDFSGGESSLPQATTDWITRWSSISPTYTSSEVETGNTPLQTPYKLFQVSETGSISYLLLVAEIGKSYDSNGYLAIKGSAEDLAIIKQILNSLKSL